MSMLRQSPGQHGDYACRATDHLERYPCHYGRAGCKAGVDAFGTLYLAMSFGLLFSVLVEFGLNQQLVRAIARDRDLAGPYLVNALAIKLALAVVAYLVILVLI